MPDDRVSAELAAIREDYAHAGVAMGDAEARCRVLDRQFPRLLAAIERVLDRAADWDGRAAETYQAAIRAAARGALPERVDAMEAQSMTLSCTAAELRAAIERALTGTESADE